MKLRQAFGLSASTPVRQRWRKNTEPPCTGDQSQSRTPGACPEYVPSDGPGKICLPSPFLRDHVSPEDLCLGQAPSVGWGPRPGGSPQPESMTLGHSPVRTNFLCCTTAWGTCPLSHVK